MTRSAHIEYPYSYDGRSKQSEKETIVNSSAFLAYGGCGGTCHEIYAELLQGKNVVSQGTLVSSDSQLWVVSFENVPDAEHYILQVRRGEGGRLLDQRQEIKVVNQVTRGPAIQYPLPSDSPVPTTFPAKGTTDTPQYPVSATMQQDGGPPIPGTVKQQVGGTVTDWIIQFTVPPGPNYTLKVTDTHGGSDKSYPLTAE